MNKKLVFTLIPVILVVIILIFIFFPEQKCSSYSRQYDSITKCTCLGKEVYRNIIDGAVNVPLCKGICLKNMCTEQKIKRLPIADKIEPIRFNSSDVVVAQSENTYLIISVYNNGTFENQSYYGKNLIGLFMEQCISESGGNITGIVMSSPAQTIPEGNEGGYRVVINVSQSVAKGTYVCEVRASDGEHYILRKLGVIVK
jgi:hypothetical protein